MNKASAQKPLQAVTQHGEPGSDPTGRLGRTTPWPLCPSSTESTSTQCVCEIGYLGRPRQDMGQEVSIAQTAQGHSKHGIMICEYLLTV